MSWKDKQSGSMDIGGNKIPGERTAVQRPWGRDEPAVARYSRGWAQRAGAWGRDAARRPAQTLAQEQDVGGFLGLDGGPSLKEPEQGGRAPNPHSESDRHRALWYHSHECQAGLFLSEPSAPVRSTCASFLPPQLSTWGNNSRAVSSGPAFLSSSHTKS